MKDKTCCFFGHRECWGLKETVLLEEIERQIKDGATLFYMGSQGQFDAMARSAVRKLKEKYPHIAYAVVLAYLPEKQDGYDKYEDAMYPEGLELVPRKFAIVKRNDWMTDRADVCICYICHTWGGAYKAVKRAKKKGIPIHNLGNAEI